MRMRGQDGVTERKKGERVLRKVTVRMRGQDELTKKGVGKYEIRKQCEGNEAGDCEVESSNWADRKAKR